MTSKEMRESPLFMRNGFETVGKWGIPLMKKQSIDTDNLRLIACSDTKPNDRKENRLRGVHFFVDDYRFSGIFDHPERTFPKYAQYAFLLSPDFSLYADMDLWRQMESVAKNRWCGAYWQSRGQTAIPSISWSTPRSYEFCFDGVEQGATVAVGMVGCKNHNKLSFMRGYDAMLARLNPANIICFGTPFKEMEGHIIPVDYRASRKAAR